MIIHVENSSKTIKLSLFGLLLITYNKRRLSRDRWGFELPD
ncbi:MAG: hypothetical protein ACE5DX_00575 [Candidatus Dojkabacteria bacterium]